MRAARSTPSALRIFARLLAFRRVPWHEVPPSAPLTLTLLAASVALALANHLLFFAYDQGSFGTILAQILAAFIIALIVISASGRKGDLTRIASAMLLLGLVTQVATFAIRKLTPDGAWVLFFLSLWPFTAAAWFLFSGSRGLPRLRRVAIVGGFLSLVVFTSTLPMLDTQISILSYRLSGLEDEAKSGEEPPSVTAEDFWAPQHRLVEEALAKLDAPRTAAPRTFILTFAPDGQQALFEREAVMAGKVLRDRFADETPFILLSNDAASIGSNPAAVGSNLTAMAEGLRRLANPQRDLLVVYLTSHGSPEAALSTSTPDYSMPEPITAKGLRAALDKTWIARRVVIVSACYSGTWIAPLKTPDTIILTASAADRTSFGCSDDRTYTLFGEAMARSPLGQGASLAESFAVMKRHIDREERKTGAVPSLPQAFVGDRMQSLWLRGADD